MKKVLSLLLGLFLLLQGTAFSEDAASQLPKPNEDGVVTYFGTIGVLFDLDENVVFDSVFDFATKRLQVGFDQAYILTVPESKLVAITLVMPESYSQRMRETQAALALSDVGFAFATYDLFSEPNPSEGYYGGLYDEWDASVYLMTADAELIAVCNMAKGTHLIVW